MDDAGNVLVRRYSKSNVYIKSTASAPNEETAIGSEVLKAPNHSLDHDKVVKVIKKILILIFSIKQIPFPFTDLWHEKISIECQSRT